MSAHPTAGTHPGDQGRHVRRTGARSRRRTHSFRTRARNHHVRSTRHLASLDARARNEEARKVVLPSNLGSTIGFYDVLLCASASAPVFLHVFFTDLDPPAGTIAAYGTFAAGYPARPLGGAVFTPTIPASIDASSGQAVAPVVRYLAGMAVISAVFILLTRESMDFGLETHEHRPGPGPPCAPRPLPESIQAGAVVRTGASGVRRPPS